MQLLIPLHSYNKVVKDIFINFSIYLINHVDKEKERIFQKAPDAMAK